MKIFQGISRSITLGRWIKKLRSEQDLNQEMLSELVGCATPTLRSFEIGMRLFRISADFNLSLLKNPRKSVFICVQNSCLATSPTGC